MSERRRDQQTAAQAIVAQEERQRAGEQGQQDEGDDHRAPRASVRQLRQPFGVEVIGTPG